MIKVVGTPSRTQKIATLAAARATLGALVKPASAASSQTDGINVEALVDDDDDSDFSFDLVESGLGLAVGANTPAAVWVTTFDAPLLNCLYFGDHLAPFCVLLNNLHGSSEETKSFAINKHLKGFSFSFTFSSY
jgi:hypothetical protein